MQSQNYTRIGIPGVIALVFFLAPQAFAQSILAIGQVNNNGTLQASANTVGGVVTTAQNGTGDYTITLTAAGAFAGAVAADFLVETTVETSNPGDDVPKAFITSVNANAVEVRVRVDDVEDATNTNGPEARSLPFFFALYRIPSVFPDPGATKYLIGLGKVAADGALQSGLGVDGITVTSSRNATGNYNVTLTKTGAFTGDNVDDYVLILSVEDAGTQDQTIRGDATSTASDDQVVFNVHTDDSQDSGDDNIQLAEDEHFFFNIYQIPSGGGSGLAASKLLVAMATVDGDAGNLIAGGQSFDGGVLASTRNSEGDYRITITSAGAFAGKTADQYVLQIHLNQNASADEFLNGEISLPDANTMHIDVNTNDLEQNGQAVGVPMDADFFLLVYDTEAAFQPDLHIGRKKNLTTQIGDDIHNRTAVGQRIKLRLKGIRKRGFFFTLENDGNLRDSASIKAKRSGSALKAKYFRISNGRKNVTAALLTGNFLEKDMAPCRKVRFKGQLNYKSSSRHPKKTLRFKAHSQSSGSELDTNKAKVR